MSQMFPELPAIESLAPTQYEAVAQVNRLEQVAHDAEEKADALRWEQAEWVARCLAGGMSSRQLASMWTNAATGKPYTHTHVQLVERSWRHFGNLGFQRPRFNDAYHSAEVRGRKVLPDERSVSGVDSAPLSELRPHPAFTVEHPPDFIWHGIAEFRRHGFLQRVLIARDGTILAGHAVAKVAAELGFARVPVLRLDLDSDDPRALMVMALRYAAGKRAMVDERKLAEILRDIYHETGDLLGTGYDRISLAELVMKAWPASEIADMNEAVEWIGVPRKTIAWEEL